MTPQSSATAAGRRFRRVLLVVVSAGAIVAGVVAIRSSQSAWIEPDSYGYTLSSWCGERSLHGTLRVRVEGGAVTRASGLDEPGLYLAQELELDAFPTIGDLLDEAADAEAGGADVVKVVERQPGGSPERIDIDYDKAAVDDEACYEIAYISAG